MSSHREAPEVSKDPVVDNTDTYAFVSPDDPSTVTVITNYLPAEVPSGGPTFYEFGNDVLYRINIDNDGDGYADIVFEFNFETVFTNPDTFLYNNGQILSLTDPHWNKRQSYSVTRVDYADKGHDDGGKRSKLLAPTLACPPCNIGPRSTPKYGKLEEEAIHSLAGGIKVFAGQRRDPFFVDIGSIFDLADLRPIEELHVIPTPATLGVDSLETINCHSIAIRVPISSLTSDSSVPTDVMSSKAVLGVWGSASRRKVRIADEANSEHSEAGPWVQVSRLGNPLVNEVLIPMAEKDSWNAVEPSQEKAFKEYFQHPELAKLLGELYPERFPHLEAFSGPREDLVAILATGIPAGIVEGFQNASRKGVFADMLRLNVAVPPAKVPNPLGLVGGDPAGWPNGRRVTDDITNVELKAVAGATIPLVSEGYKPDAAVAAVEQGITPLPDRTQATFPYVATPHSGFDFPSDTE
jgi:Domain of unknown function (DUF4331)